MNIRKSIASMAMISGPLAVISAGLVIAPASAATDGNAPTYDTTINESMSQSSSSANADVTSVNGFNLKAAQKNKVVAYVKAKGMPRSEQAKARSITLKHGMWLETSYVNIYGQEVWHKKFYAAGYEFFLGADGWYHDPECYNKVVVKQSKKRPSKGHIFIKGKIKVVKRFKFTGVASASLHELAIASSTSKSIGYVIDYTGALVYDKNGAPLINCESGASGSGRGEVSAMGYASIKGKFFATYKSAYEALVQGAANNLELDLTNKGYSMLHVKGEVRAQAKGSAESDASAFTWCRNSQLPPPPPPTTPNPAYSCDMLSVTKGDNRTVTISTFSTSQSGGAMFKSAVIEWGDGSSDMFTTPVGKMHTYGKDGSFAIKATAVFDVNGQEMRVSSNNCQAAVTFTTPPPEQPTMTLSLDRPNDVDQSVSHPETGEPTDWSFTKDTGHAVAPSGAGNVTYTVSADVGTVKFVTENSPCEINGLRDNVVKTLTKASGTYDIPICYIASTEDPASYGGFDTITLSAVFAGKIYTVTQRITINPTPVIPL